MKPILLIWVLFFLPNLLFAQQTSDMQIERGLNRLYEKIISFPYGGGFDQLDSLEYCDSLFAQKILFYTSNYPSSLSYPFDSLKKQITIVSSRDGHFRIYSWDTRDGGSMHSFRNLFQYQYEGKVYSKLSADTGTDQYYDAGVSYVHIYRLRQEKKKRLYLAIGNGIYSHAEMGTRIKLFSVQGRSLNDTLKVIQLKNEKRTNSINLGFNIMLNHPNTDRMIPYSVKYDPKSQILSVPIVVGDRDSLTRKRTIYQFNGKYLKYLKVKK